MLDTAARRPSAGTTLCGTVVALLLAAPVCAAALYPRFVWHADGYGTDTSTSTYAVCANVPGDAPCPVTPGVAVTPIKAGSTIAYRALGRVEHSLGVSANTGGYKVSFDPHYTASYGFAWMAFVWLDQFSTTAQSILWSEGRASPGSYAAGFAIVVGSKGSILASIGHNGSWTSQLASTNTVGLKAWHHVALVWDTGTYYLLVDGTVQSSVASTTVPDASPNVPVAIGSFYNAGNPTYLLNGSVDEIKFVKFTPGTFATNGDAPAPGVAGNFVLNETGLQLRKTVLNDLALRGVTTAGNSDSFATPTFAATSILRAYVNSFFSEEMLTQPQETLWPWSPPFEANVFPLSGVDPLGNSPPSSQFSLYLRMRDRKTIGLCESAALTLWGVYKAFGYATRKYDWVTAPSDFAYTDSHALDEVYVYDTANGINQYVMQDPTYNVSGKNISSSPSIYNSVMDLYGIRAAAPSVMPFSNNGYNYNTAPLWTVPLNPLKYFFYFHSITNIYDSWTP